jgi:hypothetical protein
MVWPFLSQRKFRVSVNAKGYTSRGVLSPTLYSPYINDTPQTPGVYLGLFADGTCIYMRQTARRVMFSETCSEVSVLLRRNVSARTLISMKIELRQSTFLIDLDP